MKALFLRNVKVEQHEEEVDNIQYKEDSEGNQTIDPFAGWYDDYESESVQNEVAQIEADTGFDISDYDEYKNEHSSKISKIIKNTDGFKPYHFDTSYIISHKKARIMIEEKRPFIVSKAGNKKSVVEEIDTMYHTKPKIVKANKLYKRLGYVMTDEKATTIKLGKSTRKKNKYKGVINDDYLIYKKKPRNAKKIGYLKLEESTPTKDLYVEVLTKRGYKWLIILMIVIILILLLLSKLDYSNLHLDLDRFRVYKTQEIMQYQDNILQVTLNATPTLNSETGEVNLKLSSQPAEDITYTVKIYVNKNQIIFESNELQAGSGLSTIKLADGVSLGAGEHECIIKCDTYKVGDYMGTVESTFVLKVKE